MTRTSIIFAAAFALSACAPDFNPAPDYVGGFLWDSDKSRIAVVMPGDTLYAISRRYDVPTKAIVARNGLQPPYQLTVRQELILDPARSHQVKAGDTLSKIAAEYGVELRLIAEANDLAAPFLIKVRQELWIPDPFSIAAAPIPSSPVALGDAMPPTRTTVPSAPIARQDLAPPSGTPPSMAPQPLPFPGRRPRAPMQAPAGARSDQPPAQMLAQPLGALRQPTATPQPNPAAPSSTGGPVAERTATTATGEPKPLSAPAPRVATRFVWPLPASVAGKVIASFGPTGKGMHNDGINIAAPAGAKVSAADNGVVAYSGNELKGFGNLLLIKHADGWTTAYAHNGDLLVKRGDVVKQGQDIATVGRTGNVQSPQLHFEVRKGTQAVDPLIHLERPNG